MKIAPKKRQRFDKTYNEVVNLSGSRIFLAYQFQENNILYIKEARYAKKP
jgi:hypothetical protein